MIARRLYIYELTGRPTERLRLQHPLVTRVLDEYLMCRAIGTLPRAGGLDDQYQATLDYWRVFLQAESEVRRNA